MSLIKYLIPEGYDSIVFLDIEATIHNEQRYILQLSGVKITKQNKVSYFNQNCYFKHAIPSYIQFLLKKPHKFWFRNIKFKSEKQVYEEFLKFAGNSFFVAYGNYDSFIIESCCNRNEIDNKIKIIDAYEKLNEYFNFPFNCQPSLTNFANVLGIEFINKHDALVDAKTLYSVMELIFKKIDDKNYIQQIKRQIYAEMLKPKTKVDMIYNIIKEQKLTSKFIYIADKSSIKTKIVLKDDIEVLQYVLNIDLKLSNRQAEVFKQINKQFTFETKAKAIRVYRDILIDNALKYFHNCIWLYNNNRKFAKGFYKRKKYTLLMHYVSNSSINNYLKSQNQKFNSDKQELKYVIKEIERIWSKSTILDNNISE